MNTKRYFLASLGVAVLIFFYGWIIHGFLLAEYWAEQMVEGSMRPAGEEVMWAIVASCLLQGLALAFIFIRGYQNRGIMEGFRFGLLIAWFIIAIYFLHYAVSPMALSTMVVGMIADGVMYVLCGLVLGALYRDASPTRPQFN